MNGWKKAFGVDLFDTFVHFAISVAIMGLVAKESRQPEPVILLGCASLVLFAVRRHFGLRGLKLEGQLTGETTTGAHRRLDTEERLQELEALYGRVAELEERVDFAERLLARKDEPMKLESPKA